VVGGKEAIAPQPMAMFDMAWFALSLDSSALGLCTIRGVLFVRDLSDIRGRIGIVLGV